MSTLNPTNSLLETLGLKRRATLARLQFSRVRPGCASVELGPDGVFRISEAPATQAYCNFKRQKFDFFFNLFPQIASCRPSSTFLGDFAKKTSSKGIFNVKFWVMVFVVSAASLLIIISQWMPEKLTFLGQPNTIAKAVNTPTLAATASATPVANLVAAAVVVPVVEPVVATTKGTDILVLPILTTSDAKNVKPFPSPLAPLPLPNGLIADAKSQKSLESPLGNAKLPVKKIEDNDEPVSVTFTVREAAPIKSQNIPAKVEVIAPAPKSPTWIPVTSNDGLLVVRNQGNFSQIKVGGILPSGETLKSLNEVTGKFETSSGIYNIKGTE